MKSFVVRCMYEDGDSFEWPRLVVLGKQADTLADRMIEYAESISPADCKPVPVAIEIRPFDLDAWLVLQENASRPDEVFVAISGLLSEGEQSILERVVALLGQHCIIVADAHTELQLGWRSVIRLPPHRTWDAQWAWGIRVVLDVLLEAALHRGVICIDPADILTCIDGRYGEMAVVHAEGEERAVAAVGKVVQSLSGRVDFAAAEAFILTYHAGPDIRMKEIHQGLEALRDKLGQGDTTIMALHVPTDDNRFAVSLIAATPRFKRKVL